MSGTYKFLGFPVFVIFDPPGGTPKWPIFDPLFGPIFGPLFEPVHLTLMLPPCQKWKKRGPKMTPLFGQKMAKKWPIFWPPNMSNLMFWRQNVKFWGSRGPRDTRNDLFWVTFWTPYSTTSYFRGPYKAYLAITQKKGPKSGFRGVSRGPRDPQNLTFCRQNVKFDMSDLPKIDQFLVKKWVKKGVQKWPHFLANFWTLFLAFLPPFDH